MLEVPIYTLRFWEDQFPMFNPNRTPKGTRRFTLSDVYMAKAIKTAVYDKGLKVERAIEYLNKIYNRPPLNIPRICKSAAGAIRQLEEVKSALEDEYLIERIQAVERWINLKFEDDSSI